VCELLRRLPLALAGGRGGAWWCSDGLGCILPGIAGEPELLVQLSGVKGEISESANRCCSLKSDPSGFDWSPDVTSPHNSASKAGPSQTPSDLAGRVERNSPCAAHVEHPNPSLSSAH
jgi:hypothetical protein